MYQQKGGEIIGEGSYGCVFNPPLKCSKDINTINHVGKLTPLNEANQEYGISLILNDIPYSKEYFVLIDDYCYPKARTNQNDKSISKCKLVKGVKLPLTIQLIMPFGGKSLLSLNDKITIDDIDNIGQKILEAGTLLLLSGIVHSDIHIGNVLIDYSGKLRLIDFGSSWIPKLINSSNVASNITIFNSNNIHKSIEETLISAIYSNIDIDIALAKIKDDKFILKYLFFISGKSLEQQVNEIKMFMKSSIAFNERNWVSFYKIYWKKIDAWSIGSILLYTITNITMNNNSNDSRIDKWRTCVSGLCEIDPGKRLDALEALELWAPDSKILALPEVQVMLKEQKEIRNKLINKIGVF